MIRKFRAWHKPNGFMINLIAINYSSMLVTADIETSKIYPELDFWWKETDIPFSEIELMQSTGLYDRNGVEIFEGDILFHPLQGRRKVFYPYSENVASYDLRNIDNGFGSTLQDSHAVWEVIGNIYESPGLLEVENE